MCPLYLYFSRTSIYAYSIGRTFRNCRNYSKRSYSKTNSSSIDDSNSNNKINIKNRTEEQLLIAFLSITIKRK